MDDFALFSSSKSSWSKNTTKNVTRRKEIRLGENFVPPPQDFYILLPNRGTYLRKCHFLLGKCQSI